MSEKDVMDKLNEFSQGAAESMGDISNMTLDMASRMAKFQIAAIRSYAQFGVAQLQEAAKIQDVETLQKYTTGQIEEMQNVSQKLAKDARNIVELTGNYTDRIRQITQKDISRWNSLATDWVRSNKK